MFVSFNSDTNGDVWAVLYFLMKLKQSLQIHYLPLHVWYKRTLALYETLLENNKDHVAELRRMIEILNINIYNMQTNTFCCCSFHPKVLNSNLWEQRLLTFILVLSFQVGGLYTQWFSLNNLTFVNGSRWYLLEYSHSVLTLALLSLKIRKMHVMHILWLITSFEMLYPT